MAEELHFDNPAAAAQDPSTDAEALRQLAYRYPELRPAVAAHPHAYRGLLDWLHQFNDPQVNAALEARDDYDGYIDSNGRRERVAVDHHELYVVAENSGGKKFSAESAGELSEIYQAISSDLGYELVPMEITDQYAGLAIIFAILAAIGVISLGARWP